MKDTLITAKRKKHELIIWLICFFISCLLNLYAIIAYDSPLKEMFTSIFYVFLFSCVLYAGWSALRLLGYGLKRWLRHYY